MLTDLRCRGPDLGELRVVLLLCVQLGVMVRNVTLALCGVTFRVLATQEWGLVHLW